MNRPDEIGANPGPSRESHLDPVEAPLKAQRLRKDPAALLALALIVVGAGLILGVGLGKVQRGRACLNSTLAHMRVLQDMVPEGAAGATSLDVGAIGVELHGLQDDLACVRAEGGLLLPLAPVLGWLPAIGDDLDSIPVLLEMAQALIDGGVLVFDSLSPAVEAAQADLGADSTRDGPGIEMAQMAQLLAAAGPSLVEAEAHLQRAADLRTTVDAQALTPRLGRLLELTDRYLPLLRTGVGAAQLAPELLGVAEPRRYLILAQNDDERRPTGGWISGMGLLTIDRGDITDLTFLDSWLVDNLEVPHDRPPESMLRVLWAEIWLFRDANWSPDFPTSAQIAEEILLRDQGISVDGVIAVDQAALQLLVSSLEPLALGQGGETVTGANVLDTIRKTWTEPEAGLTAGSARQEWQAHRKDFMTDLVSAMIDKVQTRAGEVDLPKLANAVLEALRRRHILVYLHQEQAARMLAAQGWDGALLETDGDYVQLVDANVGFNKVDPSVQRSMVYQVDLTDPQEPLARASVHYRNNSRPEAETCVQQVEWEPSYAQRMQGCYWDYVRFFVPEGATLREADREPLPEGSLLSRYRYAALGDAGPEEGPAEKDKKAFGLFFVLAPGEERSVDMAWDLPEGILQKEAGTWRYRLLVQKQSGVPPIALEVSVLLPPGSRVVSASPGGSSILDSTVSFETSLGTDQRFEVIFETGK